MLSNSTENNLRNAMILFKITFQNDDLSYGEYEKDESDFKSHVQKLSR